MRIREQHPAMTYRATLRCLPRQSQARERGNKGAGTSDCNVSPTKVERRRHGECRSRGLRSNLQSPWIPNGGRHPGFRESVALRGAMQERGPWSIHEDGGSIQPTGRRIDDDSIRGARGAHRGGESSPKSYCGSRRLWGRSFTQGYSARATQRCRSTIISASGDRVEASPASDVAIER